MEARMTSPTSVLPDAMQALLSLGKAAHTGTVPEATHQLMHLRASQLNGCSLCVDMHARELKQGGASDERIWAVAAWRESPHFTDAERAALALAECVTRLADRQNPVPDDVWNVAAEHYGEHDLAALLVSIGTINVWNRLNAVTHQPPYPAG